MSASGWKVVESQSDLDLLNSSFEWEEDIRTLEFFGLLKNELYFPEEISRSGYLQPNIHMLVEVAATN